MSLYALLGFVMPVTGLAVSTAGAITENYYVLGMGVVSILFGMAMTLLSLRELF